jgi:HAD superfamily hydrolase (TIGR01509 family)
MTITTGNNVFTGKMAVIFDFDGTIADTLQLHEQAFQQALGDYPVSFRYRDYAGMSTRKAISLIFSANGHPIEEAELLQLTKKKQMGANALYKQAISFMPGAEALIRLLHAKNFRLFVASSGSRMNVHAGLEALGVMPFFSGIVTADDVAQAKPHPEIFLTTLAQYNIMAQQAIVIEDAISGLQAAMAAGLDAVCIDETITAAGSEQAFATVNMFQLKEQLSNEFQR